jgi:integrase
MLAFKDARLKVVTAKSLKDGDLPGIRSVFGWAVDNRRLTKNPADSIKIKAEKKIRTRSKDFTDQEATAIFKLCLGYVRKPKEDGRTAAANQWAPLIAAYTGCRIAETLQLRRADARKRVRPPWFRSKSAGRQHRIRDVPAGASTSTPDRFGPVALRRGLRRCPAVRKGQLQARG